MRRVFLLALVVVLLIFGMTSVFAGGKADDDAEEKAVEEKPAMKETPAAAEKVSLEIPQLPEWEVYNLSDWEKKSGKKITKYNEAPILAEMVAAGKLDSVEKRLPLEPLVVKPTEMVGTYGGSLVFVGVHMLEGGEFLHVTDSSFFTYPQNGGPKEVPFVMKAFEQSADGKVITLYMREGLRWSDGQPCTADDVLFYFNDLVFGPDELYQAIRNRGSYIVDGHKPNIVKVNDYEIRFEYPVAHWNFMYYVTGGTMKNAMVPAHTCKKYHINYNKDADALAKEYGFETWVQLMDLYEKMPYQGPEALNIERPVLAPWKFKQQLPDGMIFERNPFYFQIDTDGNQLPYIDEVKVVSVENMELYKAKALSGEADFTNWGLGLNAYPVFAEEAQKGKFKLHLTKGIFMANTTYWFNQDYDADPQIGELLRDKRFRQALSLAMDREYINETLYFGKGVPLQLTMAPTIPFYKEEWGRSYADFDPAGANALLDEIGLKWDADHKFRQFADGVTVTIEVVTMTNHAPDYIPTLEIVKENWTDVGINVNIKPVTKAFQGQYTNANKFMIRSRATNYFDSVQGTVSRRANEISAGKSAPRWWEWASSGGKSGVEPPAEYKEWVLKAYNLPTLTDPKEVEETLTWLFDLQAENLYGLGTVGQVPTPAIVANDLGNIPTDIYGSNTLYCLVPFRPQDWFWKK